MTKITSFTHLKTWQEAHKMVLSVYKLTDKFPAKEQFILTAQILRAVISISSNIAEGFTRIGKKEKQQFFYTAKSSLTEVQNQLIIARDRKYITKKQFDTIAQQSVLVSKLITGLIKTAMQHNS